MLRYLIPWCVSDVEGRTAGPYSEDLRARALARYEAGERIRAIGAVLEISPSCVSKWRKLQQATGGLTPGQIGGHKKRTLAGPSRD